MRCCTAILNDQVLGPNIIVVLLMRPLAGAADAIFGKGICGIRRVYYSLIDLYGRRLVVKPVVIYSEL